MIYPTQEKIRDLFIYDFVSGDLFWKKLSSKFSGIKINSISGYIKKNGYRYIEIKNITYLAHKLTWIYHHGYISENDIDHLKRNKSNNRIEFLREITHMCNCRNQGNSKNNKSKVKGVHYDKRSNKWCSRITLNYKKINLGSFKDFDEAVLMRLAGEQCLDWSNCDSTSPAYLYAIKHRLIKK